MARRDEQPPRLDGGFVVGISQSGASPDVVAVVAESLQRKASTVLVPAETAAIGGVQPLVEMMDMRQAQRSYQANLSLITMSKTMIQRTIDLLR